MVLLEAQRVEGLIVEASIRHRAVGVLLCQSLPPVAPVIGHPPPIVKVYLYLNNQCLVGEQFWGLLRKSRCNEGGHY